MLWIFASIKKVPVWQNQKVMLFSKLSAWNSNDLLSLTVNASQVLRDISYLLKAKNLFGSYQKLKSKQNFYYMI